MSFKTLLNLILVDTQQNLEQKLSHWDQHISGNHQDYKAYVQRGMVRFQLAKIDDSIADFDHAEELEPKITPYLWQRGLSYYYAARYQEGAKQFKIDLTVNRHDAEETIWQYLCLAKYLGVAEAQRAIAFSQNDSRLIMCQISSFYAGDCTLEELLAAANQQGKRGNFYSHLYLGLYYEVAGDLEQGRNYIAKAAKDFAIADYMWYLACVHRQLRNW